MAACLKAKLVRGAKAAQAVEEAARSTPENIVKVFIGGKSKTNRIFGKRTCGLLLWRLNCELDNEAGGVSKTSPTTS